MTDIDIINMALTKLGCHKIVSADLANPSSAEAIVAADEYAAIRDAAIQSRQWTFAKSRVQLTQDSTVPAFGLAYRYVIPNTVLTIIRVYDATVTNLPGLFDDDDFNAPLTDWVVENGYVLTNAAAPVYAEVLLRVNENAFPPLFVRALVAQLAAEWAMALTENRAVSDSWEEKSMARFLLAAVEDGKQGVSEVVRPQKLPGRRR